MTAEELIKAYGLEPHVEGGYFRRVYQHPKEHDGRPMASAIFYLLKSGQVSRFHRLKSAEFWLYHAGSSLLIHRLSADGSLQTDRLGLQMHNGESPQLTVPADTIFGAEVAERGSFCLVSCVVVPGFDFRDFELLDPHELMAQFPQHQELWQRFGAVVLPLRENRERK